ncbi:O-antigen ligase family protein [Gracilibacillus sp. HCP3S3_G5_1]|uniref:O-antigen ligase family protein n=1 Tax=unclassified Gracilibacillus TaxID=2625209 RepID=UPI003F8984D4
MKYINNKNDIFGLLGLFMFFSLSHIINFFSYVGLNIDFLTNYNIIAFLKITIYLIILLLYINKIDKFILLGLIIFVSVMLLSSLLNYSNLSFIQEIFAEFILNVLPIILILLFIRDPYKILTYMRLVSYPVLILTLLIPFTDGYMVDVNYMSLAYSSIINWAVVTYFAFKEKKIIDVILTILLICNYVLFGNRGSIIIITAYLLWCLFTFSRNKINFTILTLSIFLIIIAFYERLLNIALSFLDFIGIHSRTLNSIINGQLAESSAREIIWIRTINAIRENPLGYGIGYDRVLNNGTYSHNMFLELFTSFGVILGSIVVIIIMIICFYMLYICKDNSYKALFSVFCITGFLILQLSYSIFSVYYMYVCITLFYLYMINKREKVV